MDVSIIIVNYNTKELTSQCIDSIYEKTSGISYEIILVDNASKDGSKEFFEKDSRVIYIYSDENMGFGRANNKGAEYASGKYLFLLNSDTILIENSIKIFHKWMEENLEVSACGGNLLNKDMQNVAVGGHFPSVSNEFLQIGFYKLIKPYYYHRYAVIQKITDINQNTTDYIIGADIFIRSSVFRELGGFDPSFFMYYEETDLFKRMSNSRYKISIIPNTSIIHLVGYSSKNIISYNKYKMLHTSKMLYYRKHHTYLYCICVKLIIILSAVFQPHVYKKTYFKVLKELVIR